MIENKPLVGQPEKNGEPVFDAPWQAKAFAMTVQLHREGCFQWSEWAERLSGNIELFEGVKEIESSEDYYGVWLTTLEEICEEIKSAHNG